MSNPLFCRLASSSATGSAVPWPLPVWGRERLVGAIRTTQRIAPVCPVLPTFRRRSRASKVRTTLRDANPTLVRSLAFSALMFSVHSSQYLAEAVTQEKDYARCPLLLTFYYSQWIQVPGNQPKRTGTQRAPSVSRSGQERSGALCGLALATAPGQRRGGQECGQSADQ